MATNNKYWMNDEEFKRKLSLVAEWKIPDTVTANKTGEVKKNRGRKSNEEKFQEAHEAIFLEIHEGKNPTFKPMITKVKCTPVDCADCGKQCLDGRHIEIKKYETNRPHWRKRCVTCNLQENPFTGEFDLLNHRASAEWARFLRKTSSKPYHYQKNGQEPANDSDQEVDG